MFKWMLFCCAAVALAQNAAAPKLDARLSIHTLLREDIFAGFLANDAARLAQGEKTLVQLEAERPSQKAPLTAWKGTIALTRAVRAHETNREDEFERQYRDARSLFDEAEKLGPSNGGVKAVTAGSYAALADRLPATFRAQAWAVAYRNYQAMYEMQKAGADQLPVHMKGELLGGLAQSAQRTGHAEEAGELARRIADTMQGTPYAAAAKRWIERPEIRTQASLACQTCHEPGRLAPSLAALGKQ